MFKKMGTALTAAALAASMMLSGTAVFAAHTDNVTHADDQEIITKTVKAMPGVDFSNESFTYTFSQGAKGLEDSGVAANLTTVAINPITISGAASSVEVPLALDGENEDTKDRAETYTFTESIDLTRFTTPGVYTYTVTEVARGTTDTAVTDENKTSTSDDGKTTWTYDTAKYIMRVYAKRDTNDKVTQTVTLRKLDANGNETGDKLETATFENTLTKVSDLTIGKTVTNGEYAPADEKYTFHVSFDEGSLNTKPAGGYVYTIYKADGSVASENNVYDDAKGIVLLEKQTAKFTNVPAGTEVIVTETDIASNVDTVSATKKIGENESVNAPEVTKANPKTSSTLVDENGTEIMFTNTYKDVTVTGIVTDNAPYIAMVVLAGAAVAGYIVLKRKIAR